MAYDRLERQGTIGMDNFMDKLAQKFNAQEQIKANSQAEAEEMKRLQLQVAEYERILQEIRRLNYKNTELSEQLSTMICENTDKIQVMKEDERKLMAALRDITEEQTRNREADMERRELERIEKEKGNASEMEALTALLQEKFQQADDFVHKENVKVYRNVQAAMTEELRRYTESGKTGNADVVNAVESLERDIDRRIGKKLNAVMAVSVLSMLASFAAVALYVLMAVGIIK